MNDKNMAVVLKNYKEHLKLMNDSLHDEVYKWDAVRYFQDNWDIDEDNFGAMFENAVSLASNILNNGSHPAEGIVELAKYEDEAVRNLFRDLFAEDGGDLKAREERIQDFIDKSEELRKQYAVENWRYAQDYRAVLAYLSLYSPDDNYLYDESAVAKLEECIGNGREVGNGKNFSLIKYYKFCDDIKAALEAESDLIKEHDQYLRDTAYPDKEHHILTFDFIACLEHYQLYDSVVVNKKTTKSSSKDDAQEQKIMLLEQECKELTDRIESLSREVQLLECYNILTVEVTHKKYGSGQIVAQDGAHLTVDFSSGTKNFLLPDAFSNKFLATEKSEIVEHYVILADRMKQIKQLSNELKLKEYELENQR